MAHKDGSDTTRVELRVLIQDFYRLPFHRQMAIGTALNLIEQEDALLDNLQRVHSFLTRAQQRGQLTELAELMKQHKGD